MRRDMTTLGSVLRERRLELGRTQAELACAIEVTQSSISNWEAGRTEPPLSLFLRLCDVLGVSPVQVLAQLVKESERCLTHAEESRV